MSPEFVSARWETSKIGISLSRDCSLAFLRALPIRPGLPLNRRRRAQPLRQDSGSDFTPGLSHPSAVISTASPDNFANYFRLPRFDCFFWQNGRDELEGLMCSLNPADWIKICEMLLGPAPEDFEFEPKVRDISPRALCSAHVMRRIVSHWRGTAVRSASSGVTCNTPISRCMMSPICRHPTGGVSLFSAWPCVSSCPASRDHWAALADSPEA